MTDPTPGTSKPPEKRCRNRLRGTVTEREMHIVVNVYQYIERTLPEYTRKGEIAKTTAELTLMSERSVRKIMKEYNEAGILVQGVDNAIK